MVTIRPVPVVGRGLDIKIGSLRNTAIKSAPDFDLTNRSNRLQIDGPPFVRIAPSVRHVLKVAIHRQFGSSPGRR